MRLATADRVLQVEPGSTVQIGVDVVNTSDLIDGVTAHLIGLPGAVTTVEPQLLPLFPGAAGRLTLSVDVPPSQTAGSHPVTVQVVSHGSQAPAQHVDVDMAVAARPALRLHRSPQTVRARRTGRFLLQVDNAGNTPLDVELQATVEDAKTVARFSPRTLRVEPGTTVPVMLALRGPRMITGAVIDRPATIDVTSRPVAGFGGVVAETEIEQDPELSATTQVVLKQRPILSRGLLTAAVLAGIVGLWALVFLLGLTQVLSGDPLTKAASPSFYGERAGDLENVASTAPVGTLPKTGLVAAGVGGTISGTVTAESNGLPVGRILVQVYRNGPDGQTLVSSAATQTDGTYTIPGLFPTRYLLRFSAEGYPPVWYARADSDRGRSAVNVAAQATSGGVDTVIAGLPASITGIIDRGSALADITTTVTARPLDLPDRTGAVARDVTSDGRYTLPDLPAPARYEISFDAEGYETKTLTTSVSGGEDRLQPSVVPSSETAAVTGTVVDGDGAPLGGVTVSTTVDGVTVSVVTPTVGTVGSYRLDGLPTPATYVLSYSAESYGSATAIVDLEAGQDGAADPITLDAGTGSVTGRLVGLDGRGVGGATVTVGGAVAGTDEGDTTTAPVTGAPATTTLTTGEVGAFSISGLAAPGDYTLTFEAAGFQPTTVPVRLAADGPAPQVEAQLVVELGSIAGTVRGPGRTPVSGATVTVTDGVTARTATTGGAGSLGGSGGFRLDDLDPGTYSVTVTADGLRQTTAIVTVVPGVTSFQDLTLAAGG